MFGKPTQASAVKNYDWQRYKGQNSRLRGIGLKYLFYKSVLLLYVSKVL